MWVEKRNKPCLLEHSLLQRARTGETEAFDHLFTEYKDGVYACLWHLLDGDADLVEEAVGSVFLSAYRSLGRFRGESSFSTWLYRIAVNEAHALNRQKWRWHLFGFLSLHGAAMTQEVLPKADDPAEQLLRAEEDRLLRQAVRALPEPYRTPVVLRYMSGMAAAEIAEVLRRPAGTVRYQLSQGLQILRERLGSKWNP